MMLRLFMSGLQADNNEGKVSFELLSVTAKNALLIYPLWLLHQALPQAAWSGMQRHAVQAEANVVRGATACIGNIPVQQAPCQQHMQRNGGDTTGPLLLLQPDADRPQLRSMQRTVF
jgi:hypothetical protein